MIEIKAQKWEYAIGVGTAGYMGEYNQENVFKFNSYAASLGAKYNFNPTWGLRTNISLVGINGNANYYLEPGLPEGFENKNIIELAFLPEFNFFKFGPNQKKASYTPYVFAGVGFRGDAIESDKILKRAVIPFGVGFKYNLKGALSLDSHLSYRLTADNTLDDYVGSLPRQEGTDKVEFFDKVNGMDRYMTFQIGLTYTFFKGGCPVW